MRILLIGAHGTLGQAVAAELGQRHEIITAGRNSGTLRVNLADMAITLGAVCLILDELLRVRRGK